MFNPLLYTATLRKLKNVRVQGSKVIRKYLEYDQSNRCMDELTEKKYGLTGRWRAGQLDPVFTLASDKSLMFHTCSLPPVEKATLVGCGRGLSFWAFPMRTGSSCK